MLALALLAALALQQTDAAAPPPPPAPPAAEAPGAAPAPARPRRAAPARDGGAAERSQPAEAPVLRGFDKRSGKRFSGDFDEVEVGDALRQIAKAAGWSIVLPPGRHGVFSAHFEDVPAEDALRAVLSQAGLTAVREGQIVTVRAGATFPGFGADARRIAEEARRRAERAARDVEREMEDLDLDMDGGSSDRVVHGDVVVREGEEARDVVAIRGSITVQPGAEVRDVVAVLGSVTLEAGASAREVVAVGGSVRLGPGAEIRRDAVAVGGSVTRDAAAEIGGETVSVGIPALSGIAGLAGSSLLFGESQSPAFTVGQVLAKFLVFFALGLLVLALFPRRMDVVSASFTAHPWKSILTGVLGMVALPLLLVLLVATIIGIPLVPVAALLVVAAGILGFTALAHYIGRSVPLRIERGTSVLQLAIGTAIVVLVTAIPLLGGMAWIAAALLTFGAVIRSRFGSQPAVLPTTIPPGAPPPPATA